MPDYQATIVQDSAIAAQQSRSLANSENNKYLQLFDPGIDANAARQPDYFLNIFNTVPRKFSVRRPPHHPLITLEACPVGKPYQLVSKVPNIVNVKEVNAISGAIQVVGIFGERFATDILNPSNTGTNIWAEITDDDAAWIDRGGDDLTKRGLFWTKNEAPDERELARCKERLVKFYRTLVAQAEEYARVGNNREIGDEHHMAADYFHIRSTWHIVAETPDICLNCGEPMRPGLAYHVNSVGAICVLDWTRTVNSGVKKWEDAPPELRPKLKAS